jgi:hypothetical protein
MGAGCAWIGRGPIRLEVAVPALVAAPESRATMSVSGQIMPQSLGQIGVGGEEAAEGNEIGITAREDPEFAKNVDAVTGRSIELMKKETNRRTWAGH